MIYFLIPAYNDSENFPDLFKSIKKAISQKDYRIIIVDDGSTDGTVRMVERLKRAFPVWRIGYPENHGPGYAFRYGFDYLLPKFKGDDLVVTMEADNTSDFEILDKMIKESGKFDVVLASPYASGGRFVGVPFDRRLLSFFANHLDSLIFRVKGVRTYSSFYRVYKSSILKKVKEIYGERFITEDGFGVFVELLIKLNFVGAKIGEVPSVVDWGKKKGRSKMRVISQTLKHLSFYFKFLGARYNP